MAVKPVIKGFEYFLERLLKGFRSVEKREPNNLEMILIRQEAGNKARDANKVIKVDFDPQNRWKDKKGITSLMESGDVKVGKAPKTPPYEKSQADIEFEIMEKIKSDNEKAIRAFESRNPKNKLKFKLNKERFKQDFNVTDEEVEKISLLSPEDQQKKVREYIDKDFKERIELSDYDVTGLEPNAEGGRVGHYTGGMVDVEPNLSDIGHGSDALMARTRLVSPNSQATTSTGLNYLLAEDNDNIRVPFANGNGVADEDAEKAALGKRVRELMDDGFDFGEAVKQAMSEGYAEGGRIGFSKGKLADVARRNFLKKAGAAGAGIAALKSGIIGLGKEAAPMVEAATETIKQAPSYFFDLASTIKMFGKKSKVQIQDRIDEYFMPSKDGKSELMLTEDVGTGEMQIKKIGKENDEMVSEVQTMEYSPGAARADESGVPSDDYQEFTEYNSRIYKDEYNDPMIEEGIKVEDITKEIIKDKKASGGIARMIGE